MLDLDDEAVFILPTACYAWVPPQVKAVIVERHDQDMIVHLGCDRDDERVQNAVDDTRGDAEDEAGGAWRVRVRADASPDVADWRARGWRVVHPAAEWGDQWTEPCDQYATDDPAPEWAPDAAELTQPEFHVAPAGLPPYTDARFTTALTEAVAGQITPTVEAVNVVVGASRAKVHWHLDNPPGPSTA